MALTSKVKLWVHCSLILAIIQCIYTAKLNVPKVLLPYYSSVASNFTLEVSEGCYLWRSSRPEVATVNPVDVGDPSGCASKAIVTATSKSPHRMTTIVLAEEKVTSQLLRCDIIVDVLHSIQVETTTRELYLEDSPEAFELRAMDEEGNTFSSLEGVAFEWSLISDIDTDKDIVDANNILRIQTFTDSSYETPPHIGKMEAIGLQGNMILVHGIKTGSAKVMAKLKDPVYKDIKPAVVRLVVVANLVLSPPEVYLMQHSQVAYKVELIKQGKSHKIPMPHPQYFLELQDKSIASLDTATSTVTALALGETTIVLQDRNINVKDTFHQPTASIHVVVPGYLESAKKYSFMVFVVLPGRKWVLETGRQYEIIIEIYDKDSHKIFQSDNVRVQAFFPEEYFRVLPEFSSKNGTYHVVETLQQGNTQIEGMLRAVILENGKEFEITPAIQNNQDVEIYDRIIVEPDVLVFPWDPVNRGKYQYQLTATGGSGNYTWSSSRSAVATVNIRGEISTNQLGSAVITAANKHNSDQTGSAMVHVLPPTDLQFVSSRVEAEINTVLDLPLAVFATHNGEKLKFADCRKLPLNVTVEDTTVFNHMEESLPLLPDSCTTIRVNALRLGHTVVHVQYQQGKINLKASVTIAAYKPLRPIDPESIAVIAVGSSKEVIFDGGPLPWVLNPSKHFKELTAEQPGILTVTPVVGYAAQRHLHIFHVLCRDLGEQTLTVSVGNGITPHNKFPATAKASIRYHCAEPVGLHLQPVVKHPDSLPPCPIHQDSDEAIPVHSYKDLDILVTVTDSIGRKFDNFSSLEFTWDISNSEVASWETSDSITADVIVADTGRKLVKYYKTMLMKNKLGSLTVKATVSRYIRRYFTIEGITFQEEIDPPISRTLDLLLVEDAQITPDFISVFNHPSNKVALQISKGSGYFHIASSQTHIAQVHYDAKKRAVMVSPLQDGILTIIAYDLCLESAKQDGARAEVHISGVNVIQVKVVDKVELHKEIIAEVQVLDRNGKPLQASYFPLMNLKAVPGSDIIAVRPHPSKTRDEYTAVYIVKGSSLGQTSLTFYANMKSGEVINSQPKDIQVFPPLRLEPRNITLIIGDLFQVTSYGGPQPQSTVEYSIFHDNIASISNSGLIEGLKIGNTTVVGKAVGIDSETGKKVEYSQDQVTVFVVMLTGMKIFAPLTLLQTGTEMPLYAMGVNEHETPFSFGSAVPPLSFRWTINNKEVIDLKSVYHKSGIHVRPESNFAVRLFANKEGHVTVKLEATPHPDSNLQIRNGVKLVDEVQIQVFEKLHLLNPDSCSGTLIITPNTETLIRTNRDGNAAKLSYQILQPSSDRAKVLVNNAGQLSSGPVSGHATLMVTAHENFGVNQTLTILVKVKPVAYVMLNLNSIIHTSVSHLHTLPVGAKLLYSVSYHDDVGEMFHTTSTKLRYRPNRFDLLQVSPGAENNTLVARATDVGQTVLKVWDKNNPRIADYINIEVGYAIAPAQAEVTLGDITCFSSVMVGDGGSSGTWSSDGSFLNMDDSSGIALAREVGKTSVHYTVSEFITTYTEVTVSPIGAVSIKSDKITYLSNVLGRSKDSVIPVVLSRDSRRGQQSNVVGKNCSALVASQEYRPRQIPFKCELTLVHGGVADLRVSDLFTVTAGFDASTGLYHCKLSQSASEVLKLDISTLDTSILLQVSVPAREHQPQITPSTLSLPFLPAFHVITAELLLSNLLRLSSIKVSAIPKIRNEIKATASDSNILEILPIEREDQSDHVFHVPVNLIVSPALWEFGRTEFHIELVCSLTGQRHVVPVRIKLVGTKQDGTEGKSEEASWGHLLHIVANNYQSWVFMLLCILATIGAIIIGYHAVMGPRYSTAPPQSGAFLTADASPRPPSPYYAPGYQSWQQSPYQPSRSPGKLHLWSSGYDPQEASNNSLFRRTSPGRSPYQ